MYGIQSMCTCIRMYPTNTSLEQDVDDETLLMLSTTGSIDQLV